MSKLMGRGTRAPGAKLTRLVVDRRQQRKGYGQILMVEPDLQGCNIYYGFELEKLHECSCFWQSCNF